MIINFCKVSLKLLNNNTNYFLSQAENFIFNSIKNNSNKMSTDSLSTRIIQVSGKYSKTGEKFIGYGTAGFRDKASVLDHIMFRMGIVSSLRSKLKKASIGVMITASHNPEADNGVKLVDPEGEMLENEWEKLATEIANVSDVDLPKSIENLITQFKIDISKPGSIFIARDTRASSTFLAQAVIDGVRCVGDNDEIVNYGLASTPMLHYFVVCRNGNNAYGEPTKESYYKKLSSAFRTIIENGSKDTKGNYEPALIVDCANGVGAFGMKSIVDLFQGKILNIAIVNDGSSGSLNHNCGADFVKVQQVGPENIIPTVGTRCASLDGDADRLIYFYYDKDLTFHMLDGDKISLLLADHLGDLVKKSKLSLKLGVVQTAYANGSSTNYVTQVLNIPVSCVPTGVKHLHHAAQEFDIGVYFEANGHGTVLFSSNAVGIIRSAASKSADNLAARELSCFLDVINSTVGDAISDMLAVEAILFCKGWSAQDWDAMYTDLPNRQLKVLVADRNVIKTADAERKCTSPEGLQARIKSLAAKYPNGRSFVRPSGTEDIVRVYAEANTQENADTLGKEVALAVYELCSGCGPKP